MPNRFQNHKPIQTAGDIAVPSLYKASFCNVLVDVDGIQFGLLTRMPFSDHPDRPVTNTFFLRDGCSSETFPKETFSQAYKAFQQYVSEYGMLDTEANRREAYKQLEASA